VLHQIGIGTLGPVFRTYEPTRDRLVAVKVFRLDIIPEQAQVLAAALSRAVDASLFHPSIVEPIASGVEGTLAYRAEEYVAAESLDVAMRHYAPAPIEKALPFITQLAGAIDFARAAGVGHGGLHPRDIFVTPDEARATGFGVVDALEQVGIRAPIRRPYSAPERIDGTGWSTPADIFALAAITFELLTGRRPSGTGAEIGALPEGPRSEALHAVLARAMDDDPSRRYPTALAFAGALESAARGEAAASGAAASFAAVPVPPVPVSPVPDVTIAGSGIAVTPGEFEVDENLDPASVRGGGVASYGVASSPPLDEVELDTGAPRGAGALDDFDAGPGAGDAYVAPEPVRAIAPTLFDHEAGHGEDVRGASREAREHEQEEDVAGDVSVDDEPASFDAAGPVARDAHATSFGGPGSIFARDAGPAVSSATETVYAAEAPMLEAVEPGPDPHDVPDRSGPAILPIAVVMLPLLLGAFGAGYFVGSRDRLAPPAPEATAEPAPAASGPATPQKPGQYSEQQVTPPAPAGGTAALAPRGIEGPAPRGVEGPAPARPEAARPGRTVTAGNLVVRSTPSRAAVTVNGRWRGRTPLTLDPLPFGTYVVRIVQDGFRPTREEVTLSARAASRTITARLEPTAPRATVRRGAPAAGATGSLYVDSRPRGATVFLNGKSVGQTPLSLPEVAVGAHEVRIEMAGKKTWTSTARVVPATMARVTGSLEDR
jgi:hypothetical protein